MKKAVLAAMAVLSLALVGASTDETGCGLGNEDEKKGLCWECFLPDDCESDTCTCVDDQRTGTFYCWACVPAEYDPLTGIFHNLDYQCPMVLEE